MGDDHLAKTKSDPFGFCVGFWLSLFLFRLYFNAASPFEVTVTLCFPYDSEAEFRRFFNSFRRKTERIWPSPDWYTRLSCLMLYCSLHLLPSRASFRIRRRGTLLANHSHGLKPWLKGTNIDCIFGWKTSILTFKEGTRHICRRIFL